jgi:hypothetical protein
MNNITENLSELQKKARERTVKTQNIEYDLETLVKKIKKGFIKLDPDYQRRHRWTIETSSRLIESLILNIPIPLIYLSQDIDVDEEDSESARYSVIDGQQRLTAITQYLGNEFALKDLQALPELEGARYRNLPPFLVRRLEERTIKCLRIDSTVDAQVKYDIFERLNSGSVKLEAQELRNALYGGAFNDLLKRLSTDLNFRTMLHINLDNPANNSRVKKMEDIELVLRFFALNNDNYKNFKGGFKTFLDTEMERFSLLAENELPKLEQNFLKTMKVIRRFFGDSAFAKYKLEDGKLTEVSNFNVAVYDALSTAVATEFSQNINNETGEPEIDQEAIQRYRDLFADPDFFASVEGGTTDKNKVTRRIDAARQALSQ